MFSNMPPEAIAFVLALFGMSALMLFDALRDEVWG